MKVYLPVTEDLVVSDVKSDEQLIQGSGRVLVIDDESIVRIIAGEMLQEIGYEVAFASDGREGLAVYKELHDSIDFVLLDVVMPKMNGKDLFYELIKFDPDVKVIVASGFAQDTSITKLIEDGAVGFIQKPFRLIELSRKVSEVLSG